MSDQTTDHLSGAVEAAHPEISYPIGIVRSVDGGRSITRFALEKAEPFFATYYEDKGAEKLKSVEAERDDRKRELLLMEQDRDALAAAEDKGRRSLIGKTDPDLWENPEAIDIALGRVQGHVEHEINCGIPNPADPDQSSRCNCGAESAVGQLDEVIGEALIAAEDKGRSEERERLRDVDGPVLLTIREVVGTEAEAMGFRDEEGEGVWANHAAVEALGDAVSDAVHRKLASLDSDQESDHA